MKKSPLSTPGGYGNSFHHGRGQKRGYSQTMKQNDNYHRFSESYLPFNKQNEGGMIPLETSSPIRSHNHWKNNRGNWRQPNNRYNRFSNTGISGSYNNQGPTFRNSPESSYLSHNEIQQQYQQPNYKQFQKNDPYWYRKVPISEFINLQSVSEDPWADLEKESQTSCLSLPNTSNNSSIEVLCEGNGYQNSSVESISCENTINLSSSDNVNDGSSIDLEFDSINFNQTSKSISSMSDTSSIENSNKFQKSITEMT